MSETIGNLAAQGQGCSRARAFRERFKRQVRLEVELAEFKVEAAAHEMDCDPSLISHWGGERGCDMPAWRLVRWTRTFGTGLMEWLALQCGGSFVHGQDPAPTASPMVLVGLVARQSGLTIQQILQSLQDREWSASERQADLPRLRKLRDLVDQLIQQADAGGAR